VTYLDPPYFVAGKKCYPTYMVRSEHEELARVLSDKTDWLLSYDDCPEVRDLYRWARVETTVTRYSMSSHGPKIWPKKTELLIERN
jgi:DNA adenine methylase